MTQALRTLGFHVVTDETVPAITITGRGGMVPADSAELDIGNAGTAARFLTAFLNLKTGGKFALDGDPEMRRRPVEGLLDGLRTQGAEVGFKGKYGHFPFTMTTNGLSGGAITVDASMSSQILSALLMVAPKARSDTTITPRGGTVHRPFIEMTIAMMGQFGIHVDATENQFNIPSGTDYELPAPEYQVEPDATAAGYFLTLPATVGGEVSIPGLGTGTLQGDLAFTNVLRAVGLEVSVATDGLRARRGKSPLKGITAEFTDFSDTFLTLAALAPLLRSPTRITGIAHTRAQETDRVSAMAAELRKLVGPENVREEEGALEIHPNPEALAAAARTGVTIETYEDHRIAMSFAILGCADVRGDGRPWLSIRNPLCCRKTFPGFFEVLDSLKPEAL